MNYIVYSVLVLSILICLYKMIVISSRIIERKINNWYSKTK